ncbi:MAG: class I SAM-dependent methyltransferase [Candidatus Omnitrophota bacterium]
MNKEEAKREILKITDWRHPYELEPGLDVSLFRDWHKQWHQWRIDTLMPSIQTIASHVIPGGMNSARVLDTGCWDGFYGFEFLKRGAKYLKGIDLRKDAIHRANLIKTYFNYTNCKFEIQNIQDIDPAKEGFDITLMYGLLYHLSSPIDVIKKLGDMTRSMLLISTYASKEPEPILKLQYDNPDKDSMGFQELVTTPSELALLHMLKFAGFDTILRDYPYPFYEKYRKSDFGFFYAIKSSVSQETINALFNELDVKNTYKPRLKKHQIVHLTLKSEENKRRR